MGIEVLFWLFFAFAIATADHEEVMDNPTTEIVQTEEGVVYNGKVYSSALAAVKAKYHR